MILMFYLSLIPRICVGIVIFLRVRHGFAGPQAVAVPLSSVHVSIFSLVRPFFCYILIRSLSSTARIDNYFRRACRRTGPSSFPALVAISWA